MTVISLLHAKS